MLRLRCKQIRDDASYNIFRRIEHVYPPPSIFRAISFSFAFTLSSFAWAQKADAPLFEVGDKWTYKFTNIGDRRDPFTFFNQTMHVDQNSAWLYGETQDPNSRGPQFAWRYDNKRAGLMEGFAINLKNADKLGGRRTNNMPNDDLLKFPLEIGKEWPVKETWGNGEGYTEFKAKVESFEKVKVEAGEFEAYKITLKGFWTRTANGSGSGRVERVIWYSPPVKRDVKSTYEDRNQGGQMWNKNERELVKWEPKAALGNNPVVGLRSEATAPTAASANTSPAAATPANAASAPK